MRKEKKRHRNLHPEEEADLEAARECKKTGKIIRLKTVQFHRK